MYRLDRAALVLFEHGLLILNSDNPISFFLTLPQKLKFSQTLLSKYYCLIFFDKI